MNGPHDLGGAHGFGPVAPEADEPVFHADWEKRVLALTIAMAASGRWNIDMSRHARESIGPVRYLSSSYYEIWLAGLEALMVEAGLVSRDEIAVGKPIDPPAKMKAVLTAAKVPQVLGKGGPTARKTGVSPRFTIGEKVRAKRMAPKGHTRLPRYMRGAAGEVVMAHGPHVFPDANAHGKGEAPQHLYNVRFSARDLWGAEASTKDSIHADLWETYLERP